MWRGRRDLWTLSKIEGSVFARLNFWGLSCWCGTLLVVSILDISLRLLFMDCHLWPLLQSCGRRGGEGLGEGLVVVPVGTMGSFLPRDSLFRAVEGSGGLWTLSKIESLARARVSPSEVYPAGKLSDTGKSKIAICGRFCSPEGVKEIFILLLKF